ncbi:MAG: DUF1566 domain-containing protein [Treponema sp.]|nr:DUF1566 domain-containing protein [Treponema sp.]
MKTRMAEFFVRDALAAANARVLALALAGVVVLAGCQNPDGPADGDGNENNTDTTAPVLSSGSVNMTSEDGTTVTVTFTSNKAGTYYMVLYPSTAQAPAKGEDVETAYNGGVTGNTKASATGGAEANTAVTININGLTAYTAYKAHITVKDPEDKYSSVYTPAAYYSPAGRLIFYISTSGFSSGGGTCHYLEAAPADIEGSHKWGGDGTSCSTETGIGAGAANTTALAEHSHGTVSESDLHEAARACADYSDGGDDDWFLPSKDELNQMYTNLKVQGLGGFSSFYWSSSQKDDDENNAWHQQFGDGIQYPFDKKSPRSVRAVRAF